MPGAQTQVPFQDIQRIAMRNGLDLFGITSAERLDEEAQRLAEWQRRGHAGDMKYMLREADLLADPRALLREAATVIMVAVRYESTLRSRLRPGFGRVARYAWGRDYHTALRDRLTKMVKDLVQEFGPIPFRVFSDSVPLLERGLAHRAGLGFIGKNTMVIRPKIGSLFFLAEVILGATVSSIPAVQGAGGCGSCVRCSRACPTGALDQPYTLDAKRCISYLSIEKRGALEIWEREAIGEWAFGCDICQECCPFNHAPLKIGARASIPELHSENGVGAELDLAEVLALRTNAEFERRFADTALLRPRRAGLLRNCAVVAANTGAQECLSALEAASREDSSPVVRQHAAWSISVLVRKFAAKPESWLNRHLSTMVADPDPSVVTEVNALLECSS